MIHANELRIGNWLGDRWISLPDKIDYFQVKSIKENEDWSIMEPLPLTPEILEKAGFDKKRSGYWEKDTLRLMPESKSVYLLYGHPSKAIISVHQLQNLYFALTGEELEINL